MNAPALAAKDISPARDGSHPRAAMTFKVFGGLHYIKGNSVPYFSLTYWEHRKGFPNLCESGGAGHEEIARVFPGRFDDLAALHLSNMDGQPMHAIENGAYWLAGYFGGMGQRFHGGNSKGHHGGEYREPTKLECLRIFAEMWRLSEPEAIEMAADCRARSGNNYARLKERLADYRGLMAPRWKAEAEAAIERHGLKIYGDDWEGSADA